ncbi:putative trna pseudouridine synthase b [Gossypium arboreum]|uniref:Putative trna pseudouridine synthase b n=1 Tax=Gossypium arboreum TaxID=29729 RepID=A0A0B0PFL6_GOSAR|nr:putative trna pseudouridine synthase b [Gossypium arboreum]
MPWTYSHTYIRILCHDICILAIPKVHMGLLDVIAWSNQLGRYKTESGS